MIPATILVDGLLACSKATLSYIPRKGETLNIPDPTDWGGRRCRAIVTEVEYTINSTCDLVEITAQIIDKDA